MRLTITVIPTAQPRGMVLSAAADELNPEAKVQFYMHEVTKAKQGKLVVSSTINNQGSISSLAAL